MMQRENTMQSRIIMSQEKKKRISNSSANVLKFSVGIDIGKVEFAACISSIDLEQRVKVVATRQFKNTDKGFVQLLEWSKSKIKQEAKVVYCMESTGVYYENLAYFLSESGCFVNVVLPNRSKKYLISIGLKSKNDKIDAQGLAQTAAEQNLDEWRKPNKVFVELRSLTRQRQSLQENITVYKNQLEAIMHSKHASPIIMDSLNKLINEVEQQVNILNKEIEKIIFQDDEIRQKVEKICAIKGVSTLTVAIILSETLGFNQFNNIRQLISYAGYDIVENQSGKHAGRTKISKKGNSRIRRALYMPALVTITHNEPVFVKLWERIYNRTKIKMKAYVAVQRKLLELIYTLWTKNEKYNRELPVMQSRSSSFRMVS
jgi:transposase